MTVLIGGARFDALTARADPDTFTADSAWSMDRITDFEQGLNVIGTSEAAADRVGNFPMTHEAHRRELRNRARIGVDPAGTQGVEVP